MKTFFRRNLPKSLNYNGHKWVMDETLTSKRAQGIYTNTLDQKNYVIVEVLSRNLEGKTDLHGKPYKPTRWYFKRAEKL